MTFSEGDLKLEIPDALGGRKFDGDGHGLSHCMKAVDFVVNLADRYLFIELKDPQHPRATSRARKTFIARLHSGELDEELKYKYRDSFLYEWAAGRADKPIDYLVLIALDTLDDAQLAHRKASLERQLPAWGPQGRRWARPLVRLCAVFNFESWNRNLPKYPVTRVALPARGG